MQKGLDLQLEWTEYSFTNADSVVKRPTESDDAVVAAAVEMLWPSVKQWLESEEPFRDDDEEAEWKEKLTRIVKRGGSYKDGYALANDFMRDDGDSELVDILDDVGFRLRDAVREAEKHWVKATGVIPAFRVGDEVVYAVFRNEEKTGTIVEVRSDTGHYVINVPSDNHLPFTIVDGHAQFESRKGGGSHGYIIGWELVKRIVNG